MGKFLRLTNGVGRHADEAGATSIYDQSLVVVSGTPGAGEIQGPIITGTNVTLPGGQTYTSDELRIELNGQGLDPVFDYNYVGGSPPRTQVAFTFDIEVGDRINFRIDRGP
jgi:hypothetical protein